MNFDARQGWRELLALFLLLYVYCGDDYLVNLEAVSKTTKCRDFTVIFPVFLSKMHRDFADFFYRDFLAALIIMTVTFLSGLGTAQAVCTHEYVCISLYMLALCSIFHCRLLVL